MNNQTQTTDFSAIRLKLASPEDILSWSRGEVTRPETINYRTQKPEKDGLFSERIFGPSKDWECYCGKYKKIRYKGIICDKCGVEVTRSIVRRERMGHIALAAPVTHIWFLRGVPSKIGLILDMSIQALEKVAYFANFIITKVDEDLKKATLEQIKQEFKGKKKQIENEFDRRINDLKSKAGEGDNTKEVKDLEEAKEDKLGQLNNVFKIAEQEIKDLKKFRIISESDYYDLSLRYGHVFEANIGAEAIHQLLKEIDIEKTIELLEEEIKKATATKKEKITRRLKLLKGFRRNGIQPDWMALTVVPIIPPDLRPMVPLDGGRFATSDLNDLYRRVINRNNRLKQLIELNAPEVIRRNEKRMLQEAVDALIDNSARHGKTVVASTGQKRMLKSIADMLKGKQGRFRQNLLGKRTDYSGRSVIVIGPHLKLDQCGLPKKMALELFKPFVISRLIKEEYVHNVRSANRFIESGREEIWDILEDIIKGAYVFLNRAPTLHRLGIQAFRPVLIEGKAIQIHPMVCTAFNADFDGDQMAVHVPLSDEAKAEARDLMLSSKNLLKPATGDPVATPNQDVVWGSYYMTLMSLEERPDEEIKFFSSPEEAIISYNLDQLKLQEKIKVRIVNPEREILDLKNSILETTVGRLLFNRILPENIAFVNQVTDKRTLGKLIRFSIEINGQEITALLLDEMKKMAFEFLTRSGMSWGMDDLPILEEKKGMLEQADNEINEVQNQFDMGLLTESERHSKTINIWTQAKDEIVELSRKALDKSGPVSSMIESGARGSWGQLTQIVGMKGLVTNPSGDIIELPVKGNFKQGFDVLEYFISTHGARKGLSDTALRTANAGYLTRRLVDVSQDVVIYEDDCGDQEGMMMTKNRSEEMGTSIVDRIIGRFVLAAIKHPETNETLVKKGSVVTEADGRALRSVDLDKVHIRSILKCKTPKGICKKCYGFDLGFNKIVNSGVAVGIIAAQSIGEPGTQLTMRTFHTGGVVGTDITQGLPRVEELFEVRPPSKKAFLTDVAGTAKIEIGERVIEDEKGKRTVAGRTGQKIITIPYTDMEEETYGVVGKDIKLKVKDGDKVSRGDVLFLDKKGKEVASLGSGQVTLKDDVVAVASKVKKVREYVIPPGYVIYVKDGDKVEVGDRLTEGSIDLHQLYRLKGKEAVQSYIIREIQHIYSSQGQKLNDKHIEIIVRQMFSRVYITEAGDTDLLPGDVVEVAELIEENELATKEGGKEASGDILLLGITKVSLSTKSFLSAASFQDTARVLINAAASGKIDKLEGLKENVIIGRLIPVGTGYKEAGDRLTT